MHWYQIVGWVIFAFGLLLLPLYGSDVVKLVAGPKSGPLLRPILRKTWSAFGVIFVSLGLATGADWPWIVYLAILAAYFLAWAYDFRARRQRQKAG